MSNLLEQWERRNLAFRNTKSMSIPIQRQVVDTLKRNPYFCKICGLAASMHTIKDWGGGNIRAMCSMDIESDLDPHLVQDVLDGNVHEELTTGWAQ